MNTYTAKFFYFLLASPPSFWVMIAMGGWLWPQSLFAFPGFLLLFLIFDLMAEFSKAARQTAHQWESRRAEIAAARPVDRVALANQINAAFSEEQEIAKLITDESTREMALHAAEMKKIQKLNELMNRA